MIARSDGEAEATRSGKAQKIHKSLSKNAKKGFRGYPVATIAFHVPTDKLATKVVASIMSEEGADAVRKWYSEADARQDEDIRTEVKEFFEAHGARSVAMFERIIGCPHQEGVDYLEGEDCPACALRKSRDRWTGDRIH